MSGQVWRQEISPRARDRTVASLPAAEPSLPRLLLFFPERQQALRRRTADHAGNADRDLSESRCRDAAERDRTDAHLAPEVQITPRVRPLCLELLDGGERVLANRAELHGV